MLTDLEQIIPDEVIAWAELLSVSMSSQRAAQTRHRTYARLSVQETPSMHKEISRYTHS